jgi:hypothetical protein
MNVAHRDKKMGFLNAHRLKRCTGVFIKKSREFRLDCRRRHTRAEPNVGNEQTDRREIVLAFVYHLFDSAAAKRQEEIRLQMRRRIDRPKDTRHGHIIFAIGTAADMDDPVERRRVPKKLMRNFFGDDDGRRGSQRRARVAVYLVKPRVGDFFVKKEDR